MILREQLGVGLPLGVRVARDHRVLGAVVERRPRLVERVDVDGERKLLDERAVAVLRLAERPLGGAHRLLGLLALGDLVHHAVDLVGPAAARAHRHGLVVEPARPPRDVDDAVLARERLAGLDRASVPGDGRLAVVGMDPLRPGVGVGQPLRRRHADHGVDLRAHVDRLAGARLVDVRDDRDLLDQRAEPGLVRHQPLVAAGDLDRRADRLAQRPPELHAAGGELRGGRAVHLDDADCALGGGEGKDEERRRAKRPPRADHRQFRRVVRERPLGGAAAQRDEPPGTLCEEPDPGLAAGQRGGAGGEPARDLVELKGRREVAAELEKRVLTAGGGHLTIPIGATRPALERTGVTGRRAGPAAPATWPPARRPSPRRGTSGMPEATRRIVTP